MVLDKVGMLARLKACRIIIDELLAAHRGRILRGLQAATTDEPMQFRIGVHVGDVIVDSDNLLGDGVNIARRRRSYGFDWRSGWPVWKLTGTETCSMVTSQWPSILRYASVTRTVKSSTLPFLFLPETC
jgi:hypothetical protein